MANADYIREYLIRADRDLIESEARIGRQRAYVLDCQQAKRDATSAAKLLDVMLTTHQSMQQHRRVLSDAAEGNSPKAVE